MRCVSVYTSCPESGRKLGKHLNVRPHGIGVCVNCAFLMKEGLGSV